MHVWARLATCDLGSRALLLIIVWPLRHTSPVLRCHRVACDVPKVAPGRKPRVRRTAYLKGCRISSWRMTVNFALQWRFVYNLKIFLAFFVHKGWLGCQQYTSLAWIFQTPTLVKTRMVIARTTTIARLLRFAFSFLDNHCIWFSGAPRVMSVRSLISVHFGSCVLSIHLCTRVRWVSVFFPSTYFQRLVHMTNVYLTSIMLSKCDVLTYLDALFFILSIAPIFWLTRNVEERFLSRPTWGEAEHVLRSNISTDHFICWCAGIPTYFGILVMSNPRSNQAPHTLSTAHDGKCTLSVCVSKTKRTSTWL